MESALWRAVPHPAAVAGGGPGGRAVLRWPAELAVAGRAWADGRGADTILFAEHRRPFGDVAAEALRARRYVVPGGVGIRDRRRARGKPRPVRSERRSRFAALLRPGEVALGTAA